jgi:hypothetical protein
MNEQMEAREQLENLEARARPRANRNFFFPYPFCQRFQP